MHRFEGQICKPNVTDVNIEKKKNNIKTITENVRYPFTMQCFVALVCLWAVVSAVSCQLCGPPAPVFECPPEDLPEPEPVPIIGLLTTIINTLQADGIVAVQQINDLLLKNQQDLINFIQDVGPPGVDNCKKMQFHIRQSDEFWQTILAVTSEISWSLKSKLAEAFGLIESTFSLVIDLPEARSALRELRDISRIAENQLNDAVQNRQAQWNQLIVQYNSILYYLIQTLQCVNPGLLQQRFIRVINVGFGEQAKIIDQLNDDLERITLNAIRRGFELADIIYQLEIKALYNLVS